MTTTLSLTTTWNHVCRLPRVFYVLACLAQVRCGQRVACGRMQRSESLPSTSTNVRALRLFMIDMSDRHVHRLLRENTRGLVCPSWTGLLSSQAGITLTARRSHCAERFAFSPPCLTTTPERTRTLHITASIPIPLRVAPRAGTRHRRAEHPVTAAPRTRRRAGSPMAMACFRRPRSQARRPLLARGHSQYRHPPRLVACQIASARIIRLHPR